MQNVAKTKLKAGHTKKLGHTIFLLDFCNCAGCGSEPPQLVQPTARLLPETNFEGGKMGDGEYEDDWYCQKCWDSWEKSWEEKEHHKKEQEKLREVEAMRWRAVEAARAG